MSDVLEVWISSLKKLSTQHSYGTHLRRLFYEGGVTPEEVIERSKKDFETYRKLRTKAMQIWPSGHGANLAVYALRKFLFDQGIDTLPAARLETPERVKDRVQFESAKEWKSGLAICAAAGKPYNLVFKLMLHCGWGSGEFLKFNTPENWTYIQQVLQNGPEYVEIGFKGRKRNRNEFTSLIPPNLLREIIAATPVPVRASHGYIFQDGRKIHQTKGIPLDVAHHDSARMYLEQAFKTAVKRAPIIVKGTATVHTLRSIFRTQAHKVGCDGSAAEYAMGHTVDPLGYNRCCNDKAWMWKNLSLIWEEATPQAVSAVVEENKQLKERMQKIESEKVDVWGAIEKDPERLRDLFLKAVDMGALRLVPVDSMNEEEYKQYQEAVRRKDERLLPNERYEFVASPKKKVTQT
jgi:hypothetical protein